MDRETKAKQVLEIFKSHGLETWQPRVINTLAGPRVTIGSDTASYAWIGSRDNLVRLSPAVPGRWRQHIRELLKSHDMWGGNDVAICHQSERLATAKRRIQEIRGRSTDA